MSRHLLHLTKGTLKSLPLRGMSHNYMHHYRFLSFLKDSGIYPSGITVLVDLVCPKFTPAAVASLFDN